MKKILFLCSSPFTIYNSINLLLNLKEVNKDINADIVIFKKTSMICRIACNLNATKLFDNVMVLKDFQQSRLKIMVYLFMYFFPKISIKIFGKNKFNFQDYDMVFSQNFIFVTIFGKLINKSKLFLIEDGLGSYTDRVSLPAARNKYAKLANKYIFHGNLIPEFTGQFVYIPKLITSDRLTAFPLPQMSYSNFEMLKKAFSYKDNDKYRCSDIVILSQGYTSADLQDGISCSDIFNEILQEYRTYSIIYRTHPLEEKKPIISHTNTDFCENMWELECIEQITDRHILIGFDSTSLALPKVLCNKEPIIILLYRLLAFDNTSNKTSCEELLIDKYYKHIKSMYVNKQRVMILNHREELCDILRKAITYRTLHGNSFSNNSKN